ncbi:uncharacterized protein UTRI_03190 [Ustilago trichophora]|uniref:Uncharacterized protein n=1 Tax=Ustilago trichophora TaxID=86804 RepID=A0A5C3E6W8_9BASI|nr:uncharacterized protein UTRI_03190 [Ustilago trichophora]
MYQQSLHQTDGQDGEATAWSQGAVCVVRSSQCATRHQARKRIKAICPPESEMRCSFGEPAKEDKKITLSEPYPILPRQTHGPIPSDFSGNLFLA